MKSSKSNTRIMHVEGPCFGLDSIADWIKMSWLTVVLSLVGVDALPGQEIDIDKTCLAWEFKMNFGK